jgi:hypothetical protein
LPDDPRKIRGLSIGRLPLDRIYLSAAPNTHTQYAKEKTGFWPI